jgi:hypothetical protein
MYNGRELPSLSPPYYLEKVIDISYTMNYLLFSSLTISENQLFLEGIKSLREDIQYNAKLSSLIFQIENRY